jgi:hypothetical protein
MVCAHSSKFRVHDGPSTTIVVDRTQTRERRGG